MKVLVINCGSSSLKYQVLDMETEEVLAKGLSERIGIEGSLVEHKPTGKDKVKFVQPLATHKDALDIIMKALVDPNHGVLKSLDEIQAVGHRVAHGGEAFTSSVLVNDEVIAKLQEVIPLAPLHNPAQIIGIKACQELLPGVPQVCAFDTAFHQTMPAEAYIYPVPYELYTDLNVRRYGFHGTSHRFVADEAARLMGKDLKDLKLVTCHLGNGASLCAVRYGKSVDTSMGMTPLAGLMMGTRCGDIDPAIVVYLTEHGYDIKDVDKLMNKESGVLGVSGISSDFRDVEAAAKEGNERAQLALDIFHYRVRSTIGAYVAAMDGVDGIVFTAGLGENSSTSRAEICRNLTFLGVELDEAKNAMRGEPMVISTENSRTTVMVIPTNEELMIARDTAALATK